MWLGDVLRRGSHGAHAVLIWQPSYLGTSGRETHIEVIRLGRGLN